MFTGGDGRPSAPADCPAPAGPRFSREAFGSIRADRALDVLTQALQISAAKNSSRAEGAMEYDDGSSYDLALALVQNAAIATSMRVTQFAA